VIIPAIVATLPNKAACCVLSQRGQVWTTPYSVLHMHGKTATAYILDSEYPKLAASRVTVAALTGYDLPAIKWSYPAIARQVSEWLAGKGTPGPALRNDLIPHWHYQHCDPCLLPDQTLYDMRAAYWQIASKAKSLNCNVLPEKERICWHSMPGVVESKWEATKTALEPHKRLRLAIIGVNCCTSNAGRKRRGGYYCRGGPAQLAGSPPTWFAALSLLTVRVAYELTQIQARESTTMYANADMVSCDAGTRPSYWDDWGIKSSSKGTGLLDVRAVGVWRCGEQSTDTYKYLDRCGYTCLSPKQAYRYPRPVYHEKYLH
jgi:hypothetical protein